MIWLGGVLVAALTTSDTKSKVATGTCVTKLATWVEPAGINTVSSEFDPLTLTNISVGPSIGANVRTTKRESV